MADLISSIKNIKDIQASVVGAIVSMRRKNGLIATENEASLEAQRLLRLVEQADGKLTNKLDPDPLSRISSADWNQLQDAIGIDLRSVYAGLSALEAADKTLAQIAASDIINSRASILQAINGLRVFNFLRAFPEYQDLKIVDFIRAVNNTDRSPAATVDARSRSLHLPIRYRDRVSAKFGDLRFSNVQTKVHGGGTAGGFGGKFAPDNMIDGNTKTYWAEMVSSDSPSMSSRRMSWGDRVSRGVTCDVVLSMSTSAVANTFRLYPFSEYPYNIIDICYKESLSSTEWVTLPGFVIVENVDDWIELDFPQIIVQQLRIVIEQPNYVRASYAIPKYVVNNNTLLDQLNLVSLDSEVDSIGLDPTEIAAVDADPSQLPYLSSLKLIDENLSKIDLSGERQDISVDLTTLLDSHGKVSDGVSPGVSNLLKEVVSGRGDPVVAEDIAITRYEYMFGIRELELSNSLYEPQAYYESAMFSCSGTPIALEIETEEKHPVFNDGLGDFRCTSVEWDVEVAPDVRFPIVPISDISGENYFIKEEVVRLVNGAGSLRFTPVGGAVSVRSNGKRIPSETVTVSGNDITIDQAAKNAIYTVSYNVASSDTIVDIDATLNSTTTLSPEVFVGTNKDNSVVLDFYPYIIYEIVRDPRLWTKKDKTSAAWSWNSSVFPVSVGTIQLTHGSTSVVGTTTTFTSVNTSLPMYLYIGSTGETVKISSIATDTALSLETPYTGLSATGIPYIAGYAVELDGRIWGLNVQTYEPIQVFVNDVKAKNTTDYLSQEHPAFSTQAGDGPVEYIQSGRTILFSKPLPGAVIKVSYSWLVQYLKLLATLRCSVPVNTTITPIVKSTRIRIKSSQL